MVIKFVDKGKSERLSLSLPFGLSYDLKKFSIRANLPISYVIRLAVAKFIVGEGLELVTPSRRDIKILTVEESCAAELLASKRVREAERQAKYNALSRDERAALYIKERSIGRIDMSLKPFGEGYDYAAARVKAPVEPAEPVEFVSEPVGGSKHSKAFLAEEALIQARVAELKAAANSTASGIVKDV